MQLTRRNLLKGIGGGIIAAPFVCNAANLMNVKPVYLPQYLRTSLDGTCWHSVCWSPDLELFVAKSFCPEHHKKYIQKSADGITWGFVH